MNAQRPNSSADLNRSSGRRSHLLHDHSLASWSAFLSLFLAGWAAAAEASSATIRLLAFSRVGEETEVAVSGPDGKRIGESMLALPTRQLSPSLTVPTRKLEFRSPADPAGILGRVTLPVAGDDFILVFFPAAEDAAIPYRVDALALPASGFGSGDYAFANYCGNPVGCVIGGKRLVVPPGQLAVHRRAKDAKAAGNQTIVCYEQKDGQWEATPFFSSRIIVQDGVRNLVLICRHPDTGVIDFRGIADFIEAEE
jgi:hypothetical protein